LTQPKIDLNLLVGVLDKHNVEYVVVGGIGAMAYGATRPTQDLDCVVEQSIGNLKNLAAALVDLHATLRVSGMSEEDASNLKVPLTWEMLQRMSLSTWRTTGGDLDLLSDIPGTYKKRINYEDITAEAVLIDLNGVILRVAPLQVIVESKEAANRPKDKEALPELQELLSQKSNL
jgi:hypothetical protein